MIARCGYRASRPAAWLAALAILLQVLLPLMQSPAAMARTGHGDTIAGFDIAQNLCHAPGDTAPDDQGPAPADHQQCCDFCLAVHAIGGFAPPSAPALTVSRKHGIVVPIETALILPPLRANLRQQQPRAPPVFI
jgi:hypothetical protein